MISDYYQAIVLKYCIALRGFIAFPALSFPVEIRSVCFLESRETSARRCCPETENSKRENPRRMMWSGLAEIFTSVNS
jgi:hypothetical protein